MRIIESFQNWVRVNSITESTKAAKDYLLQHAAKELRKRDPKVSPEEKDAFPDVSTAKDYLIQSMAGRGGLDQPESGPNDVLQAVLKREPYNSILDTLSVDPDLKSYPNYFVPILKFHLEHGASFEDIKDLLKKKEMLKMIDPSLEKVLRDYSERKPAAEKSDEDENGGIEYRPGFEQLADTIRDIEKEKGIRWFVESLPIGLRNQYRALGPDKKKKFINLATAMGEFASEGGSFDKSKLATFYSRIGALSSKPISELEEFLDNYVKGITNADLQKTEIQVSQLGPEVGVMYNDGRFLALSLRTENAQKILCSRGNWCLNTGSFHRYVKDAVQINIFDYSKPIDDRMHLTGTTIDIKSNRVDSSSDLNNRSLLGNDRSPEGHFRNLGYPDEMIKEMLQMMPQEMAVKDLVYKSGIDQTDPAKILFETFKVLYRMGAEVNPSTEADEILNDIVKSRVLSKLENAEESDNLPKGMSPKEIKESLKNLFVTSGALIPFSAKIAVQVFGSDSELMQRIYDRSLHFFDLMQKALSLKPEIIKQMAAAPNLLAKKEETLAILQGEAGQEMNEFRIAEPPAVKPQAPTIAPPKTRPMPKRPGPVPTKQPFKAPEPAKAEAEDVIARYEELIKNGEEY